MIARFLPAAFGLLATPALAAAQTISIDGLITTLIYLVVLGLIFWVIWWAIGYFAIPEPFNKVARVIVGLLALLVVLSFLLSLLGHPIISFR